MHLVSVGEQTVEMVTRIGVSPLFLVAHWRGGCLFSQWSLRCGGAGVSSRSVNGHMKHPPREPASHSSGSCQVNSGLR